MIRFRGLPAAAAVVLLALSACSVSADPEEPEPPSPFADCATLTAAAPTAPGSASVPPKTATEPAGVAPEAKPATVALPEVSLPCFTGGAEVRTSALRLPAVINLWASYCGPCRDELPVMQGLADRADGRYTVVGVDTGDRRSAAASFAVDHGVSFPTLFDQDRELLTALGQITLPVTLFVGTGGETYVHRAAVTVDELIDLMREHTGVTVTR